MTDYQLKKEIEGLRTWIEVDTGALRHNYKTFRSLIPKTCQLMAVAKSNAYGHDFMQYAKTMERFGVDWIGVDSITEALALRREGIRKPILVLGYTLPSWFAVAAKERISLTMSSFESLQRWCAETLRPHIHLKIDTGMHRQGFMPGEAPQVIKLIKLRGMAEKVEGVYTHFAAAKNPAFPAATFVQITEFEKAASALTSAGFNPIKHAAASGGALVFPNSHFDMVRVGIGLYGLWPSRETQAAFSGQVRLHPALAWKTIIGEIKKIPSGSRIGYDLTEALSRKTQIAILPIGYWHGYCRALSGVGHVLVCGSRAKVLGRVSMDMLSVDVTGIPNVRVGDVVTLIGRDGDMQTSADELADLAGTTNYEIVTRLNPLMKRTYVYLRFEGQ